MTESDGGSGDARREAALVDAFTSEPMAGNAAGVVADADGLDDEQMGAIANELGASETAFVRSSSEADRRVRYFTPTTEIDLCGHATIAAHARLFETGEIDAGTHSLETNVGVIEIEVTDDGRVWMTQNPPTVYEIEVDYDRLGDVLGVTPEAFRDVGAALPVAYATSGLPFLIVPVNFLEHLGDMSPDFDAVAALADEHDAAGIYAFTFDALGADSTVHGRCFVPGSGIDEDPVTGTASGACGAYLDHFAAFSGGDTSNVPGGDDAAGDAGTPDEMVFEQGHYVDRPGLVRVRAGAGDGGAPIVGGDAVTAFEGRIRVPESDDDEIIEV
ncbi:PhzF family phenazine biosynthesis protein [Halobaculum magnesiiphilum]|uniref:PhzF family phenazine biosynthesis protein n=1 Tax=Halobaculum magnesiiphilum TaxID=1017351 RepID=A0A8T8WD20_9EURY|nr:PhzF family phenazine biosynthesis protein [Halobaculum magnesiiphilum]QZP37634.1 PhzF family phenazine biosynthesis protein [Halobaculum magnesiiphilum]